VGILNTESESSCNDNGIINQEKLAAQVRLYLMTLGTWEKRGHREKEHGLGGIYHTISA
jgi:hypothetical protein